MKIAIVGSRGYTNRAAVDKFVAELPSGTVVISGGARGVDTFAAEAARCRGLPTIVFAADWKRYGRAAGPMRNQEIVDAAEQLIAFWDGKSRGTLNSIVLACQRGLPVTIRDGSGNPVSLNDALEAAREKGVVAG